MEEARNRNIRIGIVDNDPYALKVFGALIERMSSDFAVIWTCDLGAVAISRCLSPTKRPDVLVTDMSMGDVPGTEVCRAIRAKTPEVGLVGVTSYALASFHDEAARCGAQALVGKTDLNGIALAIRNAAQGLPTNELVLGDEESGNSLSFMDAATAYAVLEDTSYAHFPAKNATPCACMRTGQPPRKSPSDWASAWPLWRLLNAAHSPNSALAVAPMPYQSA